MSRKLQRHKICHTGDRHHSCQTCGKKSWENNLSYFNIGVPWCVGTKTNLFFCSQASGLGARVTYSATSARTRVKSPTRVKCVANLSRAPLFSAATTASTANPSKKPLSAQTGRRHSKQTNHRFPTQQCLKPPEPQTNVLVSVLSSSTLNPDLEQNSIVALPWLWNCSMLYPTTTFLFLIRVEALTLASTRKSCGPCQLRSLLPPVQVVMRLLPVLPRLLPPWPLSLPVVRAQALSPRAVSTFSRCNFESRTFPDEGLRTPSEAACFLLCFLRPLGGQDVLPSRILYPLVVWCQSLPAGEGNGGENKQHPWAGQMGQLDPCNSIRYPKQAHSLTHNSFKTWQHELSPA